MAELADALASGASEGNLIRVRLPSSAYTKNTYVIGENRDAKLKGFAFFVVEIRNLFRNLFQMGRSRRPLQMHREEQLYVCRFRHPLRNKTIRVPLNESAALAEKLLEHLNGIFMEPKHWYDPPKGTPPAIRSVWLGSEGAVKMSVASGSLKSALLKHADADPEKVAEAEILRNKADVDLWKREAERIEILLKAKEKEVQHWRGKKLKSGPSITLDKALKTWLKNYKGRDSDHTSIVTYDLERFINHFGEQITIESLEGREQDIDVWLRGIEKKVGDKMISIGAGRRAQIRRHVLRFLEDAGAFIIRKAVTTVKRKEVRADRGQIRWLEREQAEDVARRLSQPWADIFRVQTALGLRPDEIITLKRSDFTSDYDRVTLSPLEHLTLKQGSRTIRIPSVIQPILKRRMTDSEIAFPNPETKKVWDSPRPYNKIYNRELKRAGKAAGVPFKMDCRIPRRTCAGLLLRAGMSVERVSAVLGDDPLTIREHYAAILPHEVDPTPAALG